MSLTITLGMSFLFICVYRVAPVLESQVKAGKIYLTAIVNTHQYVSPSAWLGMKWNGTDFEAIGIMPVGIRKL